MLGRSEAVIQISQSYRGMLIKVNVYQALVWSSTLLSFQKRCFNLANAALPFVTLAGDCVVKCSAQATCCRSSTKCLQMSSPRMSPSRARLKQHLKLASQAKLFGRITWRVSPSCSQTFGNQLQWLAESGRLQGSSCATLDLMQKVGNSPNPATQGAVSPITVTKQVRKQPCLQDTEVDQGRDEDSCLSQGGKLWCFAPAESRHQSSQLEGLPKELNFAEAWRKPWD